MPEETQLPRPVCHIEACKDSTDNVHACVSICGEHVMPAADMLALPHVATRFLGICLKMPEETQLPRPVCHIEACTDNSDEMLALHPVATRSLEIRLDMPEET